MKNLRTLVILLAGGLAACSDGVSAPKASKEPAMVMGGGVTADLTMYDTTRFTITVDPSRNMAFYLGAGNQIRFPAGSICDPSSSYGPSEWDQPCAPLTTPITFNVKAWLDSQGNPRTDFDRHVRFVPSLDPTKWVVIALLPAAANANAKILYCVNPSSGCVDESLADPTLATYKDPVSGRLQRRIKHFSGYNVFSGQSCTPGPDDPDCIDVGGEMLFNKVGAVTTKSAQVLSLAAAVRAGYMLGWA